MASRSPLGSVSSLLSSRTEFRFSTHSGSTSPSKMTHWRRDVSPRTLSMILQDGNHFNVFYSNDAQIYCNDQTISSPSFLNPPSDGLTTPSLLSYTTIQAKDQRSFPSNPYLLMILVNNPSVHSLVFGSITPYRSSLLMAFASITWATPSTFSHFSSAWIEWVFSLIN